MKIVNPPDWTEDIRFDYPLTPKSLVVDAGGYKGDFASKMFDKFGCRIIILEPVQEFYDQIKRRFETNYRILVHKAGLAGECRKGFVYKAADGSSEYVATDIAEECRMLSLESLFDFKLNPDSETVPDFEIDLLKINIEGGEYAVLESLIARSLASKIKNIQVQFHEGSEFWPERLSKIRTGLFASHECSWRWEPMVWENWARK